MPSVNCFPSASVTSPKPIAPVAAPPTVALSVTETGVLLSPSVIALAPVVAATVPARLIPLGAVAVTPATNVVLSPFVSPSVIVPVFRKLVVPAMLLLVPVSDTW